jgi:tetratricopeptide (TPR) repeat protein
MTSSAEQVLSHTYSTPEYSKQASSAINKFFSSATAHHWYSKVIIRTYDACKDLSAARIETDRALRQLFHSQNNTMTNTMDDNNTTVMNTTTVYTLLTILYAYLCNQVSIYSESKEKLSELIQRIEDGSDNALPDELQAHKVKLLVMCYHIRGVSCLNLEEGDQAKSNFEQALKLDDTFLYSHLNLGGEYIATDKMKSLVYLNRAVELDNTLSVPFEKRAEVLVELERDAEAIADLNVALSINANNVDSLYARAYSNYRLNNLEEAFEDLTKIMELDPNYADAISFRGDIHRILNRVDMAIEDYNKSVQVDATNSRTFNGRAYLYFLKANYTAALADYQTAHELTPDDAAILANMGSCYLYLNDQDEGIKCFHRAVDANPDYSTAYKDLGLVHKSKHVLAYKYYSIAQLITPSDEHNNLKASEQQLIHTACECKLTN